VGKNDVFPEEFEYFLLGDPRIKTAFKKYHAELLDAQWWNQCRERVAQGRLENIYPYPLTKRLGNCRSAAI
jgi:isocitrate dehydrogenase kinase/phosphatase